MCFLHRSAVLVKFLYQLAKLCYNNNVLLNLRGLQRVISLSCVSLMGWLWFCSMSSFLQEPSWQRSLYLDYTFPFSNTVLAMPLVPEKWLIAYLFTLSTVPFHFQIFLFWTINYMPFLLSRLWMISWQRKKEKWQKHILVLKSFCSKMTQVTSVHISLAKPSHISAPEFSTVKWIIDLKEGSKYFEQNTPYHSEKWKTQRQNEMI